MQTIQTDIGKWICTLRSFQSKRSVCYKSNIIICACAGACVPACTKNDGNFSENIGKGCICWSAERESEWLMNTLPNRELTNDYVTTAFERKGCPRPAANENKLCAEWLVECVCEGGRVNGCVRVLRPLGYVSHVWTRRTRKVLVWRKQPLNPFGSLDLAGAWLSEDERVPAWLQCPLVWTVPVGEGRESDQWQREGESYTFIWGVWIEAGKWWSDVHNWSGVRSWTKEVLYTIKLDHEMAACTTNVNKILKWRNTLQHKMQASRKTTHEWVKPWRADVGTLMPRKWSEGELMGKEQ